MLNREKRKIGLKMNHRWDMKHREAGFSLIEILILITILLLTGQLILNHMVSPSTMQSAHRISQIFQQKFNWALQYAESHQKVVKFNVIVREHRIVIRELGSTTGSRVIDYYAYPDWLTIEDNTGHEIQIYANGTIDQAGTFTFYDGKEKLLELSVQLFTGSIHEKRP